MDNQQAYNTWAGSYDTVANRTRDLEARALRTMLSGYERNRVLEIGCGTGKNTVWLAAGAEEMTCLDFSAEMLLQAKQKTDAAHVQFRQVDIREPWPVAAGHYDLVSTSLVLEHIADLDFIFAQVAKALQPGGAFYLGELHPFRQYDGRKARFDTGNGVFELECFTHHTSDYFAAGSHNQLDCIALQEWFDDNDRSKMPRILSMLFRK